MKMASQHTVSPSVRFTQDPVLGHVAGQLAQTPLWQLGVSPVPHVPQESVPPHPSGAVPQLRPCSAQVVGTQTHCLFWHCSCPVQV